MGQRVAHSHQPPRPTAANPLTRRRFLGQSARGVGAVAIVSSFGFPAILKARAQTGPFRHGVASGDPLPHRVIIWTRVTPSEEATPGSGLGDDALVRWEVSTTPDFVRHVAKGQVETKASQDHTVKVDVTGLRAGRTYFYRFLYGDATSMTGRTRTAPSHAADVPSLRFGLASCSNYEGGFFAAYRHMAARTDLDFVVHVGDYIYEYPSGEYGPGPAIGRIHDPLTEIVTLSDYRRRHALYREDNDLQALHAAHPFICTWDDHEVANDSYRNGAENHQPDEGDFAVRRAAAYRAYIEWMPIRVLNPVRQGSRIYRAFKFGSLATLSMLDLRQYRDQQPVSGLDPAKDDPARVLMGRRQLQWLKHDLGSSGSHWKLVGNSVMVAPVDFQAPLPPGVLEQLGLMMGVPFNVDSWDGYTDDRRELLEFIGANGVSNVAFLTGDIHSSWACEVPRDAASYLQGMSPVAVEIVGTSVTSDNLNEIFGVPPRSPLSLQVEAVFKAANPHVKLLEFDSHGYSVVDVTRERLQADWYYISDRTDADATQHFGSAYTVASGTNRLTVAPGPLGPRA